MRFGLGGRAISSFLLLACLQTVPQVSSFTARPSKVHGPVRHIARVIPATASSLPSAGATLTLLASDDGAMWDPETQTYAGGIVPSHHAATSIEELLEENGGRLRIFGYGSLCWHPGSEGVLSLAAEGDRRVTTAPGRAVGYRRCWSQRSADHRGTPSFNGIVCTLLSDGEVRRLQSGAGTHEELSNGDDPTPRPPSTTEGLIYTIDSDLAEQCLSELDFREKGGYARDVVDVIEDDTGETVRALLYRGTPDNPAFWRRSLVDMRLAAAVMSVAVGPSGRNDAYLFSLDEFLKAHNAAGGGSEEDHSRDDATGELARMVKMLQAELRPYFLVGAGSNEHGQLLFNGVNGANTVKEVHETSEVLLVVPRDECETDHEPASLHAGGGHTALLTKSGRLHLWGWNGAGQLGREKAFLEDKSSAPAGCSFDVVPPLDIKVAAADLGHNHTVVIERESGRVYCFGDDGRGQVSGETNSTNAPSRSSSSPCIPAGLEGEAFADVAAGLFHTAAVTKDGELLSLGCGRFGQCLFPSQSNDGTASSTVGRWRPPDGARLTKVACGRRHTVALDDGGRVWSLGDNRHGQLGRRTDGGPSRDPRPVDGPLGQTGSGCFEIHSGWSHVVALVRDGAGRVEVHGWGRSDKGQLGLERGDKFFLTPVKLKIDPVESDGGSGAVRSA